MRLLFTILPFVLLGGALQTDGDHAPEPPSRWHSPYATAWSRNGETIAVTDRTGGSLWLVPRGGNTKPREVRLNGEPTGVAYSIDGSTIYVSEFGSGTVAMVNAKSGVVTGRHVVDRHPEGLALAARRGTLLVANATTHSVSLVDPTGARPTKTIRVPREPHHIAITPDESLAVVGNLLPAGPSNVPESASVISLIDLESARHLLDIRLPPGSTAVRQIAINSDGSRAYIAHVVGRNNIPSTQLERGWVNTNALTIIDLTRRERRATLLLDNPLLGAADPWGVAVSPNDSTIWISLSGVHQLAKVDLLRLEAYVDGKLPSDHHLATSRSAGNQSIWVDIKKDPARRRDLTHDLTALTSANLIQRVDLGAEGPRGLAMSPDGKMLSITAYYSSQILTLDTATNQVVRRTSLGVPPQATPERIGERLFHDARKCFQQWLSCATCHPNNGRVDGLNWDQTQDGIGNPKNNKSLLQAQHTAPMDWRATRESMEIGVLSSFHFLMCQPSKAEENAVQAYIRSLTPLPSPYLSERGSLSDAASRGRKIFNSDAVSCSRCHKGPYFTDQQTHNVGTRGPLDRADAFDTPSLVEIYRTAPYLHDGRAATLHEVFRKRKGKQGHGRTRSLSPSQIDDLVEYLKTL